MADGIFGVKKFWKTEYVVECSYDLPVGYEAMRAIDDVLWGHATACNGERGDSGAGLGLRDIQFTFADEDDARCAYVLMKKTIQYQAEVWAISAYKLRRGAYSKGLLEECSEGMNEEVKARIKSVVDGLK